MYKANVTTGEFAQDHVLEDHNALYVAYLDEDHFIVCTPKALLIYNIDYSLYREDDTYNMFYGESTSCRVTKDKVSVKNQFGVFDFIVTKDSSEQVN